MSPRLLGRMGSTLGLAGSKREAMPTTIQSEVKMYFIHWHKCIILNSISATAVVNILSFDLDAYSGYFLCFAVAMGFVMIANLNAIGIVASNFFLAR